MTKSARGDETLRCFFLVMLCRHSYVRLSKVLLIVLDWLIKTSTKLRNNYFHCKVELGKCQHLLVASK